MNAASLGYDVVRVVNVEYSQLKYYNIAASLKTGVLRSLIFLSPSQLIKALSESFGRMAARGLSHAVVRIQKHTTTFRDLKELLLKDGHKASPKETAIIVTLLGKLEQSLLEGIPSYRRAAQALREINPQSKVATEFERLAGVTQGLYSVVLSVHHIFIGSVNTLDRTWQESVAASRESFQKVVASIDGSKEEWDPELLALAEKAVHTSEQKGRTDDPQWAKNLAKSPLH